MENINKINLSDSNVIEVERPKRIKTKAEDFINISNKRFTDTLLGLIGDAEKVNLTSSSQPEEKENSEVNYAIEKDDVTVVNNDVGNVEVNSALDPIEKVVDSASDVGAPTHVYSFEKEPLTEVPKWRETRQFVSKQMPDTASSNNYNVSADFNLEMAVKNADKNSFEGRVYESGLKIINLLKEEKKKIETELSSGERTYADQIGGYELQIKQLEATFKSQIAQLEETFKTQKEDLENKVLSTKDESSEFLTSMNKKIEDKNREISTRRNEIKTAGFEARKADVLAKQQRQLAEEQAQIITGIEKFSPELLTPVKVVNLNGENEGFSDNIFTQIRQIDDSAPRTM